MTATKAKRSWYELNPEPQTSEPFIRERGGCKVGWRTYRLEADAKLFAAWARLEGNHKAYHGYDFGYQCPGSINKCADGFEVCTA